MASKDKDYRLITLITDICPLPLRKLFLKLAQSDASPGVPFTTLDAYMTFRKHDVNKLRFQTKSITEAQYNLVYPNADETKWDVSLLSGLLLGLFRRQMFSGEDNLITIIRDIRNKRQHKPGNVITTDSEFDTVWNDIETATSTLALIVGGPTYKDEIEGLINETKTNNLPRLGDTLKTWYEDIIVELRNEIRELKETSDRSLGILEATTVKRKSFSGGKSKRQKIDDPVLNKLRDQFERTLERELPEDFEPHSEVSKIKQTLEDKHYVVVSGYENTSYLATALSAIKTLDYYVMSRRVEIKRPDDWRHVDPEETDLVLYCEPLDNEAMGNERNRRKLRDMFQSMLDSATMSDKDSRVDVVIVSEHTRLEAWKEHSDIMLFKDIIELYRPTEAENPLDPEKGVSRKSRKGRSDVLENMLAYSKAYIEQWRTDDIDQTLMDSAREKFKKHKTLVITGPKGSGKTNFAVNLVSACYEGNQCVVLTETSEWKHVILGEVSVIIIDEFAGKFKYNASSTECWLSKFDLIYAAVIKGKLNVIVTCETTRFAKVFKTYGGHALLNHSIKLPGRGLGNVAVKEEPLSPDFDPSDSLERDGTNAPNTTRENDREVDTQKEEVNLPQCDKVVDIETNNRSFLNFLEMSDGTVVSTFNIFKPYYHQYYIAVLETETFKTEDSVELQYEPQALSIVEKDKIVIFAEEKQKMQHATVEDSKIKLGEVEDIPISHKWKRLVRVQGGKYIMCTNVALFFYDNKWSLEHEVTHHDNEPLFFSVSPSEKSRISKRRNINDLAVVSNSVFVCSDERIVVFDFDGKLLQTFQARASGISAYNDHLLFTCSEDIISIYSSNGFKGLFLDGKYSVSGLFYAKKDKKLFIKRYGTWSNIVTVKDNYT